MTNDQRLPNHPLIEWMLICSEVMIDTARRMELAAVQYPDLLDHSEELVGAAGVMKTWIDGLRKDMEKGNKE